MLLNSREFKFLKNYRNVYGKSSAKREYHDENVFFKVDRALSKLIPLLISNKKEFNHFFKCISSNIVLLKLGNLHQNAKRYEASNTALSIAIADGSSSFPRSTCMGHDIYLPYHQIFCGTSRYLSPYRSFCSWSHFYFCFWMHFGILIDFFAIVLDLVIPYSWRLFVRASLLIVHAILRVVLRFLNCVILLRSFLFPVGSHALCRPIQPLSSMTSPSSGLRRAELKLEADSATCFAGILRLHWNLRESSSVGGIVTVSGHQFLRLPVVFASVCHSNLIVVLSVHFLVLHKFLPPTDLRVYPRFLRHIWGRGVR